MNTEYVWVPRTMTPEMSEAVAQLKLQRIMDFMQNRDKGYDDGEMLRGISEEWETALAAAPALPAVTADMVARASRAFQRAVPGPSFYVPTARMYAALTDFLSGPTT